MTAQQLKALDSLENQVALWAGDADTEKTVVNEVHCEIAKIYGRAIRGIATAQKAVDELAR